MKVQLVVFKEDGQRRDLEMKRDSAILGRSGDCNFQIPLAEVSRRHCKLSRKDGKLLVKDLGSSNGTYVNNKRVLQAELHPGDTLTVGPVIFTIVIDGKPSEVEPVKTVLNPDTPVKAGIRADETGDHINLAGETGGAALDDSGSMSGVELEPDDSASPGPLAELEALAKQQKK